MRQTFVRGARLLALATMIPAAVAAQEAELPEAGTLLAQYAEAVGGMDAMTRHAVIRMTGTFELPAMGLSASMESAQSPSRQVAVKINVPGMGEMAQGFDGTHGWAVNPMQGPRLLEGQELETLIEQADPSAALREMANFTSATTVERTEFGGEACYKVALVWKSGRESWDCYSVDSGLMVATGGTQESPMGSIESVTVLSDYKDFSGLKIATRTVQEAMGQQQVFTIQTVEFDDVADPALFAPPTAIRTLIDQKQN